MSARLPDIFALAGPRAIRGRDMGMRSSMQMLRMGILVILGFVDWIGRRLLMIVGKSFRDGRGCGISCVVCVYAGVCFALCQLHYINGTDIIALYNVKYCFILSQYYATNIEHNIVYSASQHTAHQASPKNAPMVHPATVD